MNKFVALSLLIFATITGCAPTTNQIAATPQTIAVFPTNTVSANPDSVMKSGCGNLQGDSYYQSRPIVDDEIPVCYIEVTEIIGTYSRAEIEEILAFMETVEVGEISRIIVPMEIRNQFYGKEISELPTNLAEVFYGHTGGSLYTIEKIDGVWQVTYKESWIE